MAAVYDFPEFGRNHFMPKGDRGSMKKLRSERRALEEQRSLYDDYSQRTDIGAREIAYLDEILRRIDRHLMVVEQLIIGGIELRQQGQGLEGGMILKQKLNSFEISNDGYGVEVEKLFTRITKKTLVDIMKQLGEEENQHALMKKSKAVLMHYFMKNYASSQHTGNNVVADNRPKKREKFETVADKRFAMYQKERRQKGLEKMKQDNRMTEALISAPVKLSRPAPVRRKDVSL